MIFIPEKESHMMELDSLYLYVYALWCQSKLALHSSTVSFDMTNKTWRNTFFCITEIENFIDEVNYILAISMQGWEEVARKCLAYFSELEKMAEYLKQKLNNVIRKSGSSSNSNHVKNHMHV